MAHMWIESTPSVLLTPRFKEQSQSRGQESLFYRLLNKCSQNTVKKMYHFNAVSTMEHHSHAS